GRPHPGESIRRRRTSARRVPIVVRNQAQVASVSARAMAVTAVRTACRAALMAEVLPGLPRGGRSSD
ncbi:MAG TPA: hypothetical protein PL117_14730, partial [Accumulibacter sp.]|uniref:hypothetical protein n=1 Tax=Accumulibacter sp. TaxID=2053492 RepID=UPI002B808D77